MKLPRNESHCGAVGAGESDFIFSFVGDEISMSVTLRHEFLVTSFGMRSSFSFWSSGWSNTSLKIGCASGVKRWFGSHDGTPLGQPMVTLSLACAKAMS